MNKYTVGKATTGFGKYLLDRYGAALDGFTNITVVLEQEFLDGSYTH